MKAERQHFFRIDDATKPQNTRFKLDIAWVISLEASHMFLNEELQWQAVIGSGDLANASVAQLPSFPQPPFPQIV